MVCRGINSSLVSVLVKSYYFFLAVGDYVAADEVIAEIETDKVIC